MVKQNSSGQDYTNATDGFTIGGGITERILTVTGGNPTITASGTNVYTMPAATDTLLGRASTDVVTNKTIDASQLINTTVTASKLNLNPQTNYVNTDETTTSTTYVGFTTAQSVTITIGVNGFALVSFSSGIYSSVATTKYVSVAVSGATTTAASDTWGIRNDNTAFIGIQSMTHLFTGLSLGSTTFTLQLRTNAGTGHGFERRITAIPL
jgi:hypothetical protein